MENVACPRYEEQVLKANPEDPAKANAWVEHAMRKITAIANIAALALIFHPSISEDRVDLCT